MNGVQEFGFLGFRALREFGCSAEAQVFGI